MPFVIGKTKSTQKQLSGKTAARRDRHRGGVLIAAALSSPAIVNDLVPDLKIDRVPIDQLKPAKRRVRKPGKDHVANVTRSLKAVGQVSPVLVDRDGHIVDGHVVVEALKLLRETHVNVVCLDHLNEDQIKQVQIALNKLAEGSTWELEELRPMLEELQLVGYDLITTGFSAPELDIIMHPDDVVAEPETLLEPATTPVSRDGDLWLLRDHRLFCGDALDTPSYAAALGVRKADACFTDCPWNLGGKQISSKHGDFKMAAGEMSDEAFQNFIDTFTKLIGDHLEDGGILYSCIDWRSLDKIVLGGRRAGFNHINTLVWNKGTGGMGGLYRSAHELIPLFCKGQKPKTNNIELGRHGRDRTNVWTYPGATTPGSSAAKAHQDHPTPKPIEMVEDALLDTTRTGDVVLDPFMGSGTTLLAAERTGRLAAGVELEPAYVDVCIRRWEEMTGQEALREQCGRSFSEIAQTRAANEFEGEEDDDNE